MKKIWAPWRSKFIYERKRKGCIFCKARLSKDQKNHLVVEDSKYSFAMLNLYPYNNGHIMVAPKAHKSSLEQLSPDEITDLMRLLNRTTRLIKKVLKPDGFNIGINIGKVSGAGYPGHVHIHIVPRWKGDTNFMPVFSDVKVISESLSGLYGRLKKNVK
ncbi:HIT domain-containing protein [bacterium]|nr:MAG: HIT domain-containing protein [bacterium]